MTNPADHFIAPPCYDEIEVLHHDDDILVINKPSGLLSLSGKNPANFDSVHYRLRKLFPHCTMIHRLDLGTSGIMLLALNKAANKDLCQQFSARQVSKRYIALLSGIVKNNEALIDLPIIKDTFPRHKIFSAEHSNSSDTNKIAQAKPAQSYYQVLKRDTHNNTSLVVFQPITGRTHQLRIHSQAIGHSILGCDLYADATIGAAAPRLMLHASELSFLHPVSRLSINIHCPAPFANVDPFIRS